MRIFYLLSLLLLLQSCEIQGSLRGFVGHQKKVQEMEPTLFDTQSQLDCGAQVNNNKVVITNGKNLRNCILAQDNVIVHFWQPYCSSTNCLGPRVVQAICNKKGYTYFVCS